MAECIPVVYGMYCRLYHVNLWFKVCTASANTWLKIVEISDFRVIIVQYICTHISDSFTALARTTVAFYKGLRQSKVIRANWIVCVTLSGMG